ncbi:MAG: hypothetical protein U0V75_03410 [Ferruginibacter sp.]
MKIVEFIRLIRKHIIVLTVIPVLLAMLVTILTRKPDFRYTSQTVLYTGLATGSSIEMDKTFNYFVTNIAFENLINIINSRETQQEVAIRLLSQHLLLSKPSPKYISAKSFNELKKLVPAEILNYTSGIKNEFPAIKDSSAGEGKPVLLDNGEDDTLQTAAADKNVPVNIFPSSINRAAYELTVRKLTELMKSSDTNFVYKLLNFDHPHYSISAIASVKVQRIGTSDLIKLTYETDDAGICQQTLAILNEVCIKNYKEIKENRSDEVVKYFEEQLKIANGQLKTAEDKLLAFNKANNIINYYEQSKAVAVVKEDMEVDYNNKKAQLAGNEAAIRRLEEKLDIQQLVQLKSSSVLDKKRQLGEVNYELAEAEAEAESNEASRNMLPALKRKAESLKADIKKSVDDLYAYQNSTDGLPVQKTLSEWINNVIEAENLKARLQVMDRRNREFQQQYSIYAPAGANIKRIEREISVSEQGYLEILHGLNLAKLKVQDNELASDLKAIDPPYYPISPVPNKRKVLIIAAALIGAILVLAFILMMEYFDNTLKNLKHASKNTGLQPLGMIPKVYLKPGIGKFRQIQKRLVEIITQNIQQGIEASGNSNTVKVVTILSSTPQEGKSVITANIIKELKEEGKKILLLDFSGSTAQVKSKSRFPFLYRLMGYKDPRVSTSDDFLLHPSVVLGKNEYIRSSTTEAYYAARSYKDLLAAQTLSPENTPDYIFIELPAMLQKNHPAALLASADMNILVCRSSRIWSEADNTALAAVKSVAAAKTAFILNGVELQEVETMLGELPKKRSVIRKKIKSFFRFQFFSKNQF